jgi:asparagine synthase (glutamine-hydrolysing)
VEHQTIDIPRFPLARIVEGNARAALSTANPCLELGVWETLDQTLGFTSGAARLFFGDNAFGHDPNWRLSTYADALAWLPMPDVAGFDQLRPFLSSDHFERTKLSYAEIFETLLQKGPASRSPVDVKDFFYFDQRVAYALMPWRDRFCGRHGQPVNPLLDARVLDFYRHVPAEYRRRRRLYRQTVETLYPEFFKRKRATSTGSTIVPRSLLQEDPSWVQGQIQSLHPALSELVSATSIGGLWPGLSAPASAAKTGMKARARKLLKNTWLGEAVRGYFPRSSAIPRDVILLRLLIADASVKMVVGCD